MQLSGFGLKKGPSNFLIYSFSNVAFEHNQSQSLSD